MILIFWTVNKNSHKRVKISCIRQFEVTIIAESLSQKSKQKMKLTPAFRINLATPKILDFFFFGVSPPCTCAYDASCLSCPLPLGVCPPKPPKRGVLACLGVACPPPFGVSWPDFFFFLPKRSNLILRVLLGVSTLRPLLARLLDDALAMLVATELFVEAAE